MYPSKGRTLSEPNPYHIPLPLYPNSIQPCKVFRISKQQSHEQNISTHIDTYKYFCSENVDATKRLSLLSLNFNFKTVY